MARASTFRHRTFAFSTLLLLVSSSAAFGRQPEAGVREAFDGYKSAILAGDGKAAVQYVSQSTIDYFGEMQKLALHGAPADVRAQSMLNQLMILSLRHRLQPQQVKAMSPREILIYGVDNGWIGKTTVVGLEPGPVEISGNVGTIEILQAGKPSGVKFRFQREGGGWRIDLVPVLALGNTAMKMLAKQQGVTEEFLILSLLESVSGRKVPATIWDPLVAK
jgi:hypothetical protein